MTRLPPALLALVFAASAAAVAAAPAPAAAAAPGAEGTPAAEAPAGAPAPQAAAHEASADAELESYEEATEEREESLSTVMLGHVSDSYLLEFPGYCQGPHGGPRHLSAECEVNLRHVFGKSLVFQVGGHRLDMTPTRHLVMLWIASALLVLVALAAAGKRRLVPSGLYNFVELLVQFVRDEIARKNIGAQDGDRFLPFLVTAFFFILFVNLFGLVPWSATATGNVAVTLALALFTFCITQYASIRSKGLLGWLHHLTGGVPWMLWPIMVPVEVMGLFTKPFALTIRLFANMIAGHIVILSLLGLIFALGSPFVAFGSVPMALAIFLLELFVSFVQAYIFTMLSSLFIGEGVAHGHGDDEHGAAEPGMGHAAGNASHVDGKAPGHG